MNILNPQIQETQQTNAQKAKENYTKVHHNQIVENK